MTDIVAEPWPWIDLIDTFHDRFLFKEESARYSSWQGRIVGHYDLGNTKAYDLSYGSTAEIRQEFFEEVHRMIVGSGLYPMCVDISAYGIPWRTAAGTFQKKIYAREDMTNVMFNVCAVTSHMPVDIDFV